MFFIHCLFMVVVYSFCTGQFWLFASCNKCAPTVNNCVSVSCLFTVHGRVRNLLIRYSSRDVKPDMLVVHKVDTCHKFAFFIIIGHKRAPKLKFHELKLEAINAPSCRVLLGSVLPLVFILFWDLVCGFFTELEVRLLRYPYNVTLFLYTEYVVWLMKG
jgi:hypothetical protein